MPEKLGKIEKPSADRFQDERKLYCVPLLPHLPNEVPEDYEKRVERFWHQVSEQISNLEKMGKISKVYHESVSLSGKNGLKAIEQMNEYSCQLVKSKFENGAEILSFEDPKLFSEFLDWSMCLSVVGRSLKVMRKILEFQREATKKRDEYIVKRIDKTLKKGEAGMLIATDQNRIRIQPNLPPDIQVFLVHPPAFDDFQRWLQKYLADNIRSPRNKPEQD